MATQNHALLTLSYCLLRRAAVEQATGDSRSTLYRKIQKGLFTRGVAIGGERVAWPANEVSELNKARIAGKSDAEIKQLVIELETARAGAQA